MKLTVVPETGSTNADLRRLAEEGAPHGSAVLAYRQTAGRGRLGRTWVSGEGTNLHLSVLVRPAMPMARVPLCALATAVATAEVCDLRIKWPNDLLDDADRKMGGILAEMDAQGGQVRFVVLGLGLNVNHTPDVGVPASSLRDRDGRQRDVTVLAEALVPEILRWIRVVETTPGDMLSTWKDRSATLGRRVAIGDIEGIASGIRPDGALLVTTEAGEHCILAGDVSLIGQIG